jgi:PAS domain S-box-containing protein
VRSKSGWPRTVTLIAGCTVAVLGAAVLVAWQVHFIRLIQVLPGRTPTHRMTALGLLLSGVGLALAAANRRRAAGLCAALLLALASLVLAEYLLGANLGIDELLGRDYLNILTSHRGRMSPVSALCFLSAGLALMVMVRRRPAPPGSTIVGILGSLLTAVGLVSALGHLLGFLETYGWSRYTRMSLFTSAGAAAFGVGSMAWAWYEDGERHETPQWLPLGLGLGLAVATLGIWQALMVHPESEHFLISKTILAGGVLGAALLAFAVAQAQRARNSSRKLQASGMMLQQLFETAPDGLLMIDRQGRILRANQRAEDMFGYTCDEILAEPIENLVPRNLRDLERVSRPGSNAASPSRAELLGRRKDGSEFPVEISLTPLQSAENETVVVAVVSDITERKQAQEVLRDSEERFRNLFEQGPIGIVLMGMDRRIIKVNSAFCRMLGYSEAELTGLSPLDITFPEDRRQSISLMERLFQAGFSIGRLEKRYVKKSGEIIWGTLTSSVVRDREGKPLYTVGTIEDITERKRAEAEVRLGNEIFANMEEAVGLIRMEDDIIAHANFKFERMFGYGPGELTGKRVTEINAGVARESEEIARSIKAELRRAGLWRGEILHRRKNSSEFWCAVTVSIFHHPEFGEVGISIHQDITELKKAQAALRESEERFRNIFEQAPMGVALLGTDHKMSKANPAFCRMLGYSEAELSRMTPLEITHPDDRASCGSLLVRLDRGEIPVCKTEKRYVKKNGEIIWISLTASVIRDHQGKPLCGLGMVEDISERKKAEKKLAEQAALLDLARDAITVRDLEGRIIFWSRGATDMYGWSAEEAQGRKPRQFLDISYPMPLEKIEAAVLARGVWEGELEQVTRDKEHIVVASSWSLWRDERGAPRAMLVINRDITERKHTEEQLRSLMERLSLATRSASIGIWDWDLRNNQAIWDDITFANFGIPKALSVAYEDFTRLVHPDDLPALEASLQQTIHGKTQDLVEFRVIRPDGTVRHLSSAMGVVLDERGKAVRVVGTSVDITERKLMEAQIEANREQLITSARLSALGMMAGNIAHEINNPVGIIHALASNLIEMVEQEEAVPPEVVARSGRRIRETAERISGIVKSLLQISREGSSDRFHTTRVGKILDETLEICRARFRAHEVRLIVPSHPPEFSIACREAQIAQVLLNLLQNALDAVVERTGERWVRLDIGQKEDFVVISVTDSGTGIPPELRSRIMEPFFTTKPVGKGTGLGLSLSKTIAEEHGGSLEFSEDQGRTRFSLLLPLVREAEAAWK